MKKISQHYLSSANLFSHAEIDQGCFRERFSSLLFSALAVLALHFAQCKSFFSLRVIHTTGLLSRIPSCLPLSGPILHLSYPRQEEGMWVPISISDERRKARRSCLSLLLDKTKYMFAVPGRWTQLRQYLLYLSNHYRQGSKNFLVKDTLVVESQTSKNREGPQGIQTSHDRGAPVG